MGWGFSLYILSDFSGTGSSLESWRSIREEHRVFSFLRKSSLPLCIYGERVVSVYILESWIHKGITLHAYRNLSSRISRLNLSLSFNKWISWPDTTLRPIWHGYAYWTKRAMVGYGILYFLNK
ncbi:hypothetical protein PIB30_049953 [Stylosanthes scabra]|uniref:Maturase K n=1 Tax=Stylosanthes scabra TaxID=79078 RepID=A0ABU6UIY1_9FABA|nr:hypothetical protein [Stylosanthes scabra]